MIEPGFCRQLQADAATGARKSYILHSSARLEKARIKMLVTHFGELEKRISDRFASDPSSPCDLMVREFFEPLFGVELIVAAGRVVDSRSVPGAQHASAQILLCRAHGPRLQLDGLTDCFLAESVVAAISVLHRADAAALSKAAVAAREIKQLRRSGLVAAGAGPLFDQASPAQHGLSDAALSIPCFAVALGGPADMDAVHVALKQAYRDNAITEPDLPPEGAERVKIASPAIDGVFVLGHGFLNFDNTPFGFFDDAARLDSFGACWSIASAERGSLVSLFMQIHLAAAELAKTQFDPRPYLRGFRTTRLRLGN